MTRATPARSAAKARKRPGGAQPKRPRGRPPKYRPEFAERVTDLCLLGATNEELAKVFGVDDATISRWLDTIPEFCSAVKKGCDDADANVARALYLKATGQWTQPAVKIATKIETLPDGTVVKSEHIVPYVEHFPPDTAAAFIWLKNRQPHRWRDKKEIPETSGVRGQQGVVLKMSPRARQHIEEVKELLFGKRPSAGPPQANGGGRPQRQRSSVTTIGGRRRCSRGGRSNCHRARSRWARGAARTLPSDAGWRGHRPGRSGAEPASKLEARPEVGRSQGPAQGGGRNPARDPALNRGPTKTAFRLRPDIRPRFRPL